MQCRQKSRSAKRIKGAFFDKDQFIVWSAVVKNFFSFKERKDETVCCHSEMAVKIFDRRFADNKITKPALCIFFVQFCELHGDVSKFVCFVLVSKVICKNSR